MLFWQFPNCAGAIDKKHIVLQAPGLSGSQFYNYKNAHSIVLLAVVDAQYRFTYVNIGAYRRQSDGNVFKNSSLGKSLAKKTLNLPPAKCLPQSTSNKTLPYVFVGDEAFPLMKNLMRPFPGRNLQLDKTIFNYRLSRACRIVENAFGILSSMWWVFRRLIALALVKGNMLPPQLFATRSNILRDWWLWQTRQARVYDSSNMARGSKLFSTNAEVCETKLRHIVTCSRVFRRVFRERRECGVAIANRH